MAPAPSYSTATTVLAAGDDPAATITFFTEHGFVVERAAAPERPAVLVGHGLRLELRPDHPAGGTLVLTTDDAVDQPHLVAPNGTTIEIRGEADLVAIPEAALTFTVTRAGTTAWTGSRAGARARDLLGGAGQGRIGARLVHHPTGGALSDPVHFRRAAVDLVYCAAGWIELSHAGQGPPFVLEAGDAMLAVPGGRRQARACGPDTVLVEVTVPSEPEVVADPHTSLPTPGRAGDDHRFVRHVARAAVRTPWGDGSFDARRLPLAPATGNFASGWVLTPRQERGGQVAATGSATVLVVTEGSVTVAPDGVPPERLELADTALVPAGTAYRLDRPSADLELLAVTIADGVSPSGD